MKNYVTKKLILSFAIATLISSQALAVTTVQSTYRSEHSVSDKQSQTQVFKIIDYFSKHYPYSKPQLDQYFQINLTPLQPTKANDAMPISRLYDETTHKKSVVNEVELRTKGNAQRLILTLQQPICYDMTLIDKLLADNYTGLVQPPFGFFAKVMDEKNRVGTLSLMYKTHMVYDTICISHLIFDTSKPFSKQDDIASTFNTF